MVELQTYTWRDLPKRGVYPDEAIERTAQRLFGHAEEIEPGTFTLDFPNPASTNKTQTAAKYHLPASKHTTTLKAEDV
jgi:hypothetical protein